MAVPAVPITSARNLGLELGRHESFCSEVVSRNQKNLDVDSTPAQQTTLNAAISS